MARMSKKLWLGALCALGSAALLPNFAAAQGQLSVGGFSLMGADCPAKETMSVQLVPTPGGVVTAFELSVSFTGANAAMPTPSSFQVSGPNGMKQCAIAVQLAASGAKELKVNLNKATFKVRADQGATGSVTSSFRLGRATSRSKTQSVMPSASAAAAAGPIAVVSDQLGVMADVMGTGVLMINVQLQATGSGTVGMDGIGIDATFQGDVTG